MSGREGERRQETFVESPVIGIRTRSQCEQLSFDVNLHVVRWAAVFRNVGERIELGSLLQFRNGALRVVRKKPIGKRDRNESREKIRDERVR